MGLREAKATVVGVSSPIQKRRSGRFLAGVLEPDICPAWICFVE